MIRVLVRELFIAVSALVALTLAALVVADSYGAPAWPAWSALWTGLTRGDAAAIGGALRLGVYALLALLAALIVLRVVIAALVVTGLEYPFLAHAAEVLRLPAVRRAAGATAVGLMLGPAGSAAASGLSATRLLPRPLPALTVPRPPAPGATHGVTQRQPRRRRVRRPRRVVTKRVGLALLYTVRPGDTLSLIAERLYGDWRQDTRILRASRSVTQTDGQQLSNPNVIYPGWTLRVPLPLPALSVVDGHVIYIVQPGDTLSEIAARFLGDWRRYVDIDRLTHGLPQSDGTTLQNDNLIQPGWVLRLPLRYTMAVPDGSTVTRPVIVADTRPARLRPGIRAHRRAARLCAQGAPRAHATRAQSPQTRAQSPHAHGGMAGIHVRSNGLPRRARLARHLQPRRGRHLQPRHGRRVVVAPVRAVTKSRRSYVPPSAARQRVSRRSPVARARRPASRLPGAGCAAAHQQRALRYVAPRTVPVSGPVRPIVHVPDLGRDLPVGIVLGVLALATAIAAGRRRASGRVASPRATAPTARTAGATAPTASTAPTSGALAPSVQRALRAARDGVDGALTRALRRTPAVITGVARTTCALEALERVGHEMGVPYSLAGATRLLVEGADTMELAIEAPRLPATQIDTIVHRLGTALNIPATARSGIERDGTPVVTVTLKSATLAAPAAARPHPAPLLVPLGATASGAVVHLHLGRTGGLLVAGGGQALVATLLASTLFQAGPEALRLLVASDDDELRKALCLLDHLDAPPADARDPRAVAALIAQAHTLVLERYERFSGAATASTSDRVPCLLVLAGIEALDDEAIDRLDAVAQTGPACGVYLVATTHEPSALAAKGLLTAFRTRLARRLAAAESQVVCPDVTMPVLGAQEVLLYGLGTPQRLTSFTLTPPEVREVCATVAASMALTMPTLRPLTPAATIMVPPSPPSGTSDESNEQAAHAASTTVANAPARSDAGPDRAEADEENDGALPASEVAPGSGGPPIRLELLGGITVFVRDRLVHLFPRERNLLAALAIMGPRPVQRGDLIAALFADHADGGDRLSHTLSELRTALRKGGLTRDQARDLIRRSNGGYVLHQDVIDVDLWRFDALLRDAERLDEADAVPLRAAAFTLLHGPLCAGEALDFLEEHSYRWMKRVAPAMFSLADSYRESGDRTSALHWARRLLADQPCDNHANQLLLNLLAEQGDAAGLDAHVQEMHAHYDAYNLAVDPYTLRLYEQLRRKLKGESETKAR